MTRRSVRSTTTECGAVADLAPIIPIDDNDDVGVALVVGYVKRRKKEKKKERNSSLDWTVLSISLSYILSIHIPPLSWPLNEALMRDIAVLRCEETEYYTSREEGNKEDDNGVTATANTI